MNRLLFATRNIWDKGLKILGNTALLKFYWQTYVLSRFEQVKPDVYVISYPKCGRTWFRVLLQNYLRISGYDLWEFHNKSIVGGEDIPTIKFDHDQGNWVPAPLPIDKLSFQYEKYQGKKIIFMVRDPRDVLVSSWYHLRYRERIYNKDLSAFIRDDMVGIRKLIAFMNMWLEDAQTFEAFFMLTYEQMHADTPATFRALLEFMDLPVDAGALLEAVEASSFKAMRKMESGGILREPWMKPGVRDLDKSMKVRKGKVGGYREELSAAECAFLDDVIREQLSPKLSLYIH